MTDFERQKNIERLTALLDDGARLTDTELLTVLLYGISPVVGSEVKAYELISKYGTLSDVCSLPYELLSEIEGVGQTGARLLKAVGASVFNLYNAHNHDSCQRVFTHDDAVKVLRPYFIGLEAEVLYLMLLDSKHKVIDILQLARGNVSTVVYDIRLVLEKTVKYRAAHVVLAHNHTTSVLPSVDDVSETKKLVKLLRHLGVEFGDHLIFCGNEVMSMKMSGRLNDEN